MSELFDLEVVPTEESEECPYCNEDLEDCDCGEND